MTVFSAFVLLFLVMDPLGNVPFFLSALKHVAPGRRRRVVVRELLIALGFLIAFLFAGRYVLTALQITEPALSIAAGVILFLIALRMIFPSPERPLRESIEREPFIVPRAVPYVAGPSALATVLLMMSQEPGRWPEWLLAVLLAWAASSLILFFGSAMSRFIGERGLVAIERLMGMVLITISVQMLLTGIQHAIAG